MKRILLCLSAALYLLFIHAEKIKHPALLYTPQRIEQAKIRIHECLKLGIQSGKLPITYCRKLN